MNVKDPNNNNSEAERKKCLNVIKDLFLYSFEIYNADLLCYEIIFPFLFSNMNEKRMGNRKLHDRKAVS
jgi:hypothetical protein